jgi:uncharacterized protein involved in exopolysaccharide biosynthesis
MTRAIGPRSVASGSELQARAEQAIPVHFSPLAGGDWAEDEATRARRRRLRWQRAGVIALALTSAAAILLLASRVYEARSAVLIRPPSVNGGVPQAIDGALQSEVEILRSSEVVRGAIEQVGLESLYPSLADEAPEAGLASATDRVKGGLAVRTLPGSDVIEVTFQHGEAEVAADVVNRVVERFQASRREALAPVASERFLTERIEEQQRALAEAESELAYFHAAHPALAASDPRRSLADRRATLESGLRSLRDQFDAARAAGSSEDPSVQRARERLDELELELQRTLNTHVEGSRAVSKLRHEIGLVREYLATKEQAATREQGRRFEVLRTREKELAAELAALEGGERGLPELERQARELERVRDVMARRLDAYQRELESASVAADVGGHNVAVAVRVLEAAHAPTHTLIPPARARVAVALTGAALLALAGAALLDWLERRRSRRQPMVWTAHVGAGGESGSVALLMPNSERGSGGGPVVLLLSGAGASGAGSAAGPAADAASDPDALE